MNREWTFGRRVGVGFGLSAIILVFVSVVGYVATAKLVANDGMVKHSYEVRRTVADLFSGLKDAETGQRGFLITGLDSYLDPYRAAVSESPNILENLRKLTVDNPDQQARLGRLKPLVESKFRELRQTIDLRQQSGFEAAQKIVLEDTGKVTMDQIRELVGEIDRAEADLLAHRRQLAAASARMTNLFLLGGCGLGVVVVALVGWFTIRTLTTQIGSAIQKVQSSSAELQAVASQQASGAKEQSSAMTEVTTTLSELLATSRQIAESAVRVSKIAEQAATTARAGDSTVAKSQEAMANISRQVDSIVSHMLELGRKSQHIGAVVDIVSELAEQTNILAINATIEAAGAGEAGKRFAVVADEIRKLAERVTGSTKEIRTLIDDVRGAVNTTVMATETGSKSVEAGNRHFGEVTSSFKEIAAVAVTTNDAAREIELSTKQQATAVEQVNIAITNVAQATREAEASSAQTLQTASQLGLLSKDLMRIIQPEAPTQHVRVERK
ncbi:MAG: CHASE3 domain-containing protein [Vulcanimicrobiota bacterium]